MISSWDSYYVVFLSAILSLAIPAGLALISILLFPRSKAKGLKSPKFHAGKPNRTILGQRINIRFFLAANAALILITLALALIPCVTTLQTDPQSSQKSELVHGLASIVTLAGFAVLGLLYSVRKGDMGWLSSFNTDLPKESQKEKKNG